MTTHTTGRYASVNGLDMYYEVHGTGQPLVLLHGGLSATGTSFGAILPTLAETRQVIAVEQQGHGHTADIDRPLTMEQMAEDTAALLRQLGLTNVDLLGYSLGAGVAIHVARQHPSVVRKLVLASVSYTPDGLHPGVLDGIDSLQAEHLAGTPFEAEYAAIAPNPSDWATLLEKTKQLDANLPRWTADDVRSITAPVLLVIGDSDIVRPEHTVEIFRLLGGGVIGDKVGLPSSQLAVLPGTTHLTLVHRADLLLAIIPPFLDAPLPRPS